MIKTALQKDAQCVFTYGGIIRNTVAFLKENQLCDAVLWKKTVQQFRDQPDGNGQKAGWRGEYWGKMMRGACMIAKYDTDPSLYSVLENSVRDLLSTEDPFGRICSYSRETEFSGWDIWCRKYVLLGLQYFLEICRDDALRADILNAMCRQADYILAHVGTEEGKVDICQTSELWGCVNSCSILEPIVRLFELTGKQAYLDFVGYIVSTGFCSEGSLIDLAFENTVAPYQYPSTKAYEIMSCFEGLLEYYLVTGIERYRIAVVNFVQKVCETELSIIGCSGCTHELFDHTAWTQTRLCDDATIIQETCVGVTWMKLCASLLTLTADPTYADRIEQTFYNHYLGAVNTHLNYARKKPPHDIPQILPFDSYSPLTSSRRGKKVGGYQMFSDFTFYGCCAAIGAAGVGNLLQSAVMRHEKGLYFNFYSDAAIVTQTPAEQTVTFKMETGYPFGELVRIRLAMTESERFQLAFRIPKWADAARMTVNGEPLAVSHGYAEVMREWTHGDVIELCFPKTVKKVLPPIGAENERYFAAFQSGAIVLAADRRVTDPDAVLPILCDGMGTVDSLEAPCPTEIPDCMECRIVTCQNGETVQLIDYASAGKTWKEDSKCAVWLLQRDLSAD